VLSLKKIDTKKPEARTLPQEFKSPGTAGALAEELVM
jgi:hypothetical protein